MIFHLFILSFFIFNIQCCYFVLVGKKGKFAHDVGAACVFDNGDEVMNQYDSFALGVKSFGFDQNDYHVEYYKKDKFNFAMPNGTVINDLHCKHNCKGANYDCFNNDGSPKCQALCDIAYNRCIQWFNEEAQ